MDVSSYIGKTIKITAFVKTQDKKIRMGLDGAESKLLVEEKSLGDWTELSTVCEISEELNSAYLFLKQMVMQTFIWMIFLSHVRIQIL